MMIANIIFLINNEGKKMKNVESMLKERGFIEAMTSDEIASIATPLNVYVGFDPTSDSLHLGNLVGIMGLAWFKRYGHNPIALVGGATGMIGDPSGRSAERSLLDSETIATNLKGIRRSLEAVLQSEVKIVNNYDWFAKINFIDFLRDYGKHFRMGTMLAKESVKTRLNSEDGMSFTEFSYQLLQAYDFLHLYDSSQVTVQMGGTDQWGNITAGTELVRKLRGASVHGITWPLLTRSDGKKFGKSEEGAIWLNADKLPVYDFYQYLFRLPDADIPKLLRLLTFLDLEEIQEIEASMSGPNYMANAAQKRLAEEVTRIVHGEAGLQEALRVTQAVKPGSKVLLDAQTFKELAVDIPHMEFSSSEIIGKPFHDILVAAKMLSSKGEARRMILGGGISLNNVKVSDEHSKIEAENLIDGQYLLIGMGKSKKLVIRVI